MLRGGKGILVHRAGTFHREEGFQIGTHPTNASRSRSPLRSTSSRDAGVTASGVKRQRGRRSRPLLCCPGAPRPRTTRLPMQNASLHPGHASPAIGEDRAPRDDRFGDPDASGRTTRLPTPPSPRPAILRECYATQGSVSADRCWRSLRRFTPSATDARVQRIVLVGNRSLVGGPRASSRALASRAWHKSESWLHRHPTARSYLCKVAGHGRDAALLLVVQRGGRG
jgi:hypothetical protein